MTDYVSIWAEACTVYASISHLVEIADRNQREALDLAIQVEKLKIENYELKQQLAIAASDSDFRIPNSAFHVAKWPNSQVPSRVQLLIDGNYEDGFWYVRNGMAKSVARDKVRLDVRIVRGWRPQPDTGEYHD